MLRFETNQLHLIATILLSLILGTNAYSYKDAKNWGKKYPQCNGKHQSPITLKQDGPTYFPDHKKMFRLINFDKLPKKVTIANTGHTVELKADWSGKPPTVTGGPLNGTYVFEKATFHWAPKQWPQMISIDTAIEGTTYEEMEMHAFFYRTDLKSFKKAETKKEGLAVFNMPLISGYSNFERVFDNLEKSLHKVQSLNSTSEVPPFRIASILENEAFLFYEGSLDYPPCTESVSWITYETSYPISDGLIRELRKIKLSDGDVSNVRPPQALNNRRINNVYNHKGNEDLEKWINSKQ